MSTKEEPLALIDDTGEIRFLTEEDLESVQTIAEAVSEAVASSPWPDMDPEAYFIWMYSIEPFAEA
jgi:hypothetical protein